MSLFNKKYLVRVWTDCMCGEAYENARSEFEAYKKFINRIGDDGFITKAEVYLNGELLLQVHENEGVRV